MSWLDLDMELERGREDFERRLEEGKAEIRQRIEQVERCCKDAEAARRRDWEELEGRLMTEAEKRQHESDGIQRLFAVLTDEYVKVFRSVGELMEREFAEGRAEARAQTEAILKLLDRLPPSDSES
jgi:hypothetical protein